MKDRMFDLRRRRSTRIQMSLARPGPSVAGVSWKSARIGVGVLRDSEPELSRWGFLVIVGGVQESEAELSRGGSEAASG